MGFNSGFKGLNVAQKSTFRQHYRPSFSPTVPPFATRISRVVWTWRRLAAEVGTSKITGGGSHNKPIGCGASGAYAPGPDNEEPFRATRFITAFTTTRHHSLNITADVTSCDLVETCLSLIGTCCLLHQGMDLPL